VPSTKPTSPETKLADAGSKCEGTGPEAEAVPACPPSVTSKLAARSAVGRLSLVLFMLSLLGAFG
jgi:hypothetical protein